MEISEIIRLFAAKSSGESKEHWLPVYVHAMDTAYVIEHLFLDRLSEHERRCVCSLETEKALKLLIFLALNHDDGKLTAMFQADIALFISRLRKLFEAEGILLPEESSFNHAIAGEKILYELGVNEKLCEIVGSHHGKPRDSADVDKFLLEDLYDREKNLWMGIWKEWLDYSLEYAGYNDVSELPQKLSMTEQMLITGLLITADWIASDQSLFPLFDINEEISVDFAKRFERAKKELKLPQYWKSDCTAMDGEIFKSRFGFMPNALQSAVIEVANNAEKPVMMIIEAQMGIGKTESALAAAEIMAAKFGLGGVFFGLPTQATTNCIFEREIEWLDKANQNQVLSMRLVHSNADTVDSYLALPSVYSVDFDSEDNKDKDGQADIVTHSWFEGRKKSLLADFVVGTVDQILMASLKQKHIMLRHLGLAGKVVIIDECHAYDAYMNVYLDRTLRWLGEYKVPVIILSATLPSARRNELLKAYMGKRNYENAQSDTYAPDTLAYPIISWTDGTFIKQKTDIEQDFTEKTVRIEKTNDDGICDILNEKLYDGGCVGIIVNTIEKAQKLFDKITDEFPSFEVKLYHSRYIMTERAEREKELVGRVGKQSKNRDGLIVIGTQVLEQSLDLDFDLMITELCPMDLLLQRIGRLHRHNRIRPELLEEPCCYVIDGEGDEFDEPSEGIYGRWLLGKTRRTLPQSITLPKDISSLVGEVYGEPDEEFMTKTEKNDYCEYQHKRKQKSADATSFLLTEPKKGRMSTLHGMLNKGYDVNDERRSEAKVRDSEDSLEVIVLKKVDKCYVETINEKIKLATYDTPSMDEAREISKEKIKLPHFLCMDYNIGKTISELEKMSEAVAAFQASRRLRGELFLILDENDSVEINGIKLTYDREKGLIKEEIGKED